MIGFINSLVTLSLNYIYYSAVALQFSVTHALGFSVYTSHSLAMGLNTEIITWNHSEIILSSTTKSLWLFCTENSELTDCIHISYKHSALVSQYRLYISFTRTTQKTYFVLDSYCCNALTWWLFTGRYIETGFFLLLPCVYFVARCLTVCYLATLWPSLSQYY
jgi:hypothetical protein